MATHLSQRRSVAEYFEHAFSGRVAVHCLKVDRHYHALVGGEQLGGANPTATPHYGGHLECRGWDKEFGMAVCMLLLNSLKRCERDQFHV